MYSAKIIRQDDDIAVVAGYGVVFGGVDLEGETFTADTDYQLELVPTKPVFYDHTHNDAIGTKRLGTVKAITADDAGLFVEAELAKSADYVAEVLALVEKGVLGFSSGSIAHLARREGAIIKSWPVVEFSLTATPAEPRTLGIERIKSLLSDYPALADLLEPDAANDAAEPAQGNAEKSTKPEEVIEMTQEQNVDLSPVLDGLKAIGDQMKALNERVEAVEAAEKAAGADNKLEAARTAAVVTDASDWKYDNYDTQTVAMTMATIKSAEGRRAVPNSLTRAFYRRLESAEAKKDWGLRDAARRAKSLAIKADEANFSTNTSYGDEWVGVAYSNDLWEKVRVNTFVLDRLSAAGSTVAAPPGAESVVFPIEGTDPVWYTVSQGGDPASATAQVTNTVPAKALGTGSVTATLSKSGTSVIYTGEMVEDSVLPFVATLRSRLVVSGAEIMEAVAINGDTDGSATTNINDIGGTPAATDWFMAANGFRKLCLVTNTANSRDGGALASADFIETVKLMGDAGIGGLDPMRLGFVLDPYTHFKAVQLTDVKSLDVFTGATIESGRLASIYGSPVFISGQMHKGATNLLANSAGKVDLDTQGNNTTGAILAVRWDQWRFGYRRDMTIEVERIPRADAWEITALMRYHLSARDNEASAISYNLTV